MGGLWVVGCEERTWLWLWLSGERVCVWEEDFFAVRKSVYFHCQESSVFLDDNFIVIAQSDLRIVYCHSISKYVYAQES